MAAEDYIHPIIQAMQFAQQRADEQKRAAYAQQNIEVQQQLAQDQFKEAQQQHKDEMGQKNAQLAIEQAKAKADLQTHDLNVQNFLKDFFAGGGQPTATQPSQNFIPTVTNPTQQPDLSVGGIPVSADTVKQYQGLPEAQFNRQYSQQQKLEGLKLNNEETLAVQKAALERETQKRQLGLEHANRMDELAQAGVNTAGVAEINHRDAIQLENMRGQFQLAAARIAHQQGLDDQAPVIQNLFDGILSGQTDYSKLSKAAKSGVDSIAGTSGFVLPTDRKDFTTKVDAAVRTDTLFNQLTDLALKYSRDGTAGSGYVGNLIGQHIPGTELKSALDTVKTNGGALVKTFEGMSRSSDADILRQTLGSFDPAASVQENLKKINDRRTLLNKAVRSTFSGMPDAEIKYILGQQGVSSINGFDGGDSTAKGTNEKSAPLPPWLTIAPKTVNGMGLDIDESLKRGKPAYAR